MRYQFNRRAVFNRRTILGLALGATLAGLAIAPVRAEDTIKVGILHSLSGTMAISETTLKDVMLMLIDEQNKKGGLLGKKLEAGRGGSGVELAALRREGERADRARTRSRSSSAAGRRCRENRCCPSSRS